MASRAVAPRAHGDDADVLEPVAPTHVAMSPQPSITGIIRSTTTTAGGELWSSEDLERLLAVPRRLNGVPLVDEHLFEGQAGGLVVVHDENPPCGLPLEARRALARSRGHSRSDSAWGQCSRGGPPLEGGSGRPRRELQSRSGRPAREAGPHARARGPRPPPTRSPSPAARPCPQPIARCPRPASDPDSRDDRA
jgi:hypothetical protein